MFEAVKEIIVENLSVDADKVTLDANIFDDLGADSLDAVELTLACEEKTGIRIPEEELDNIKTVRDIVEYLEAHQ